ncbi:Acyl carrier protein 4 [Durusdinium trenchii]|uniref:Chloroplastic n=1 Tax=Durusdinium trenchii TaxID=1381693 RepID=A0ABP0QXM2_9DINO
MSSGSILRILPWVQAPGLGRTASDAVVEEVIRVSEQMIWYGTKETGRTLRTSAFVRLSGIIKQECPSFGGRWFVGRLAKELSKVSRATRTQTLQAEADSLDTLEAHGGLVHAWDHFKVELEDEWMEEVETVQDLADLIWRTPRGLKLRTVDDETYIAMIRKSHAENRWGELYDGWEKDIPPQYEHRGPSLAEEAEREKQAESKTPAVDVASLTVPQLRAALRTLGLEDSGTKLELRERLAGDQDRRAP